jgi:regulator of protease activity HflC (stomatin/prohibitin superfamily)
VLVTDIVPDAKVKSAMNDINAAQREQVAANARGEAEKILVVKRPRPRRRARHCKDRESPIKERRSSKGCRCPSSSSRRW